MRYFFRVEYDGTGYDGWQHQKNRPSIQDSLERAFSTVTRVPCRVTGAGRTDAGVHAKAQGAHIDVGMPQDVRFCEHSVTHSCRPPSAFTICSPSTVRFMRAFRRFSVSIGTVSAAASGRCFSTGHGRCFTKSTGTGCVKRPPALPVPTISALSVPRAAAWPTHGARCGAHRSKQAAIAPFLP